MLRDDIMDAAFEVIGEKGYEKATVGAIIKKAGCSKGGFYHHFESKVDILQAITDMYMDQMEAAYDKMMATSEAGIIEQLNQVFLTINDFKKSQFEQWPKLQKLYMHSDSHIILRKMADDFEKLTARIYLKLIEEGVSQGLFDVAHKKALAGLWSREMIRIYSLAPSLISSYNQEDMDDFIATTDFIEKTINMNLGFYNKADYRIVITKTAVDYVNVAKVQYEQMFS